MPQDRLQDILVPLPPDDPDAHHPEALQDTTDQTQIFQEEFTKFTNNYHDAFQRGFRKGKSPPLLTPPDSPQENSKPSSLLNPSRLQTREGSRVLTFSLPSSRRTSQSSWRSGSMYSTVGPSQETPVGAVPPAEEDQSLKQLAAMALHTEAILERTLTKYLELREENERLKAQQQSPSSPPVDPHTAASAASGGGTAEERLAAALAQVQALTTGKARLETVVAKQAQEIESLKSHLATTAQECATIATALDHARQHHEEVRAALEAEREDLTHQLGRAKSQVTTPRGMSLSAESRSSTQINMRQEARKSLRSVVRMRLLAQETLVRGLLDMDQLRAWRFLIQLHETELRRAQRRAFEAGRVSERLQTHLPWAAPSSSSASPPGSCARTTNTTPGRRLLSPGAPALNSYTPRLGRATTPRSSHTQSRTPPSTNRSSTGGPKRSSASSSHAPGPRSLTPPNKPTNPRFSSPPPALHHRSPQQKRTPSPPPSPSRLHHRG